MRSSSSSCSERPLPKTNGGRTGGSKVRPSIGKASGSSQIIGAELGPAPTLPAGGRAALPRCGSPGWTDSPGESAREASPLTSHAKRHQLGGRCRDRRNGGKSRHLVASLGHVDKRFDERAVWEVLLKQAGANLAISNAILAHTQRVICAETADDMEPDRLDAWYCADGDAKAVASIAGQIVKTASPPTANSGIGTKRVTPPDDAPPVTPKSRRNVGAAIGADALDTPPKDHPSSGLHHAGLQFEGKGEVHITCAANFEGPATCKGSGVCDQILAATPPHTSGQELGRTGMYVSTTTQDDDGCAVGYGPKHVIPADSADTLIAATSETHGRPPEDISNDKTGKGAHSIEQVDHGKDPIGRGPDQCQIGRPTPGDSSSRRQRGNSRERHAVPIAHGRQPCPGDSWPNVWASSGSLGRLASVGALPEVQQHLNHATPGDARHIIGHKAPAEPIVDNGTLAIVGCLGRPPESEARNANAAFASKPAFAGIGFPGKPPEEGLRGTRLLPESKPTFGSLVRPPETNLRGIVPNGPLAPSGSLGGPPESDAHIAGKTAHTSSGTTWPTPAVSVDDSGGAACRKPHATPTPFFDQGRVGGPPDTAAGCSGLGRDPTPNPMLGDSNALVEGGTPRVTFGLLAFLCLDWQDALACGPFFACWQEAWKDSLRPKPRIGILRHFFASWRQAYNQACHDLVSSNQALQAEIDALAAENAKLKKPSNLPPITRKTRRKKGKQ